MQILKEKNAGDSQEKKRLSNISGLEEIKDIYVCSGGLDIRKGGKITTPAAFSEPLEGDSSQSTGGKYIALAAVHINDYLPGKIFHTSAYQVLEKEKEVGATHAHVYAEYLKKRGIDNVQEHGDLWITNTFAEVINVAKVMRDQKLKSIGILTRGYHLPRIKAMVDIVFYNKTDQDNSWIRANGGIRNTLFRNMHESTGFDATSIITPEELDDLINEGIIIDFFSDEEILSSTRYHTILEGAKHELKETIAGKENKWNSRIISETKGVEMLYSGTYGLSQNKENSK